MRLFASYQQDTTIPKELKISDNLVSVQFSDLGQIDRHIGPRDSDIEEMLHSLGFKSLDELARATVPEHIFHEALESGKHPIERTVGENEWLKKLKAIA